MTFVARAMRWLGWSIISAAHRLDPCLVVTLNVDPECAGNTVKDCTFTV